MFRKGIQPLRFAVIVLLLGMVAGDGVLGQTLVRVPQDADLQQAINQVQDGGVIEISAGTYFAPNAGFRIRNLRKSLTLRAAAGAQVILDGGGTNRIVRYADNMPELGDVVVFENLIFQNGFSDREADAGGVSVANGNAVFTGCTFRDNRAQPSSTGGGGVRVDEGARATFNNCEWSGNSSSNRGGALALVNGSRVEVFANNFTNNRVNLPTHIPTSPGGAIYAVDSELVVTDSVFESNEAGWVGGAIFLFGVFKDPLEVPAARAVIRNSTFVNNRSVGDPCCAIAPPTFAGAVHAEDQATLEIYNSHFLFNRANRGGALETYRAIVKIEDSIFQGNEAESDPSVAPAGGAIHTTAADFADSSTNSGAINRRTGELTVTRTLFQGRFETVGTTATQGGCLLAGGDSNRLLGQGGVAQDGDLATNQLPVTLTDVVFFDCDVESHPTSPTFGGALNLGVVDLTMTNSLVLDSDALDNFGVGGGLVAFSNSTLDIEDTTFANNSAVLRGGAMAVLGSHIEGTDLTFINNEVSPGVNEPIELSEGAALYMAPFFPAGQNELHRDVTGFVEDSDFVNNNGLPILDVDLDDGPINDVRYNNNRFRSTVFGNKIYLNPVVDFSPTKVGTFGENVAELNSLVVNRSGAANTNKSQVNNQSLASTPRVGQVVAAPAAPGFSPPNDSLLASPAFLGFAWSGPNATLAGDALGTATGLFEATASGDYDLRVANTLVDTTTVSCTGGSLLCLTQDRFRIAVDWRTADGNSGSGQVVPIPPEVPAADSGLFFFFDADNWEMLIKVLNACGLVERFWVFAAATTNVEYTLRVTDTFTGDSKTYFNPLNNTAPAITDTDAFATCSATPPLGALPELTQAQPWEPLHQVPEETRDVVPALVKSQNCTESSTELCLNQGRFRTEVEWRDFQGNTGAGEVVQFGSDDSGLFYFFAEDNWEMLIKVLNACGLVDRYWVFFAATTTVEFTLRVTDTETGQSKEYFNPLNRPADTILDTDAFATCP